MIFSKPCQYAILAMTYLARQEPGRLSSIREIGEHSDVPPAFLSKVIGTLSRRGLVTSRRGPHGGVMLRRAPGKTTVGNIVEAIDGPFEDGRCALGFAECNDETPCAVHRVWWQAREKLERTVYRATLLELTRAPERRVAKRKR